jgi:hypothetical protein
MGYQLNNNKATDLYGMYLERPNKTSTEQEREQEIKPLNLQTEWKKLKHDG